MSSDLNRNEANNIVVGLDIGTTKISAIVGKRNEHGKIEVIGMGRADSNGVMRGVVANIEKTVDAIKAAVAEASEKSGFEIKEVYVGIAGQHISSLQHRGILMRENIEEEISNEDIERIIKEMHRLQLNPGERIIDVLPQEFIVDNEPGIKEPVGMSGVRLEANFHIIIGQISAIKNIYKCVKKAGLEVKDLFLEPLASSASVLNNEELEAGVALVDIGGGTTDIAIFQDEIIRHTCVIPFGGNIITEDIKEGCMIMRNQAEQLKVKFGSALGIEASDNEIVSIPGLRGQQPREISVKNLAHIIQARMEEIMEHVFFEIKSTGFGNKLIGGIVLTGGGSMLTNLVQLVEYITGMSARVGYPTEHLTKGNFDHVRHPMYATGIGLIIKGFEDQDEKAARAERKRVAVLGIAGEDERDEEEHEEEKQGKETWYRKIMDIGARFFNEEDKEFE
jgi:cell division protein FtsA